MNSFVSQSSPRGDEINIQDDTPGKKSSSKSNLSSTWGATTLTQGQLNFLRNTLERNDEEGIPQMTVAKGQKL